MNTERCICIECCYLMKPPGCHHKTCMYDGPPDLAPCADDALIETPDDYYEEEDDE